MQVLGTTATTVELSVLAERAPGIVDITDHVTEALTRSGISNGVACIYCLHTTCGVLINELEDGLEEDLGRALAQLVSPRYFAHDDMTRRTQNIQGPEERANGIAHVRQMLFGSTSQMVPVVDGRLVLGTWQRILFLELDEPHPRRLLTTLIGA